MRKTMMSILALLCALILMLSCAAEGYPEYLNLSSAKPIVVDDEKITLKVAFQEGSIANSNHEDRFFYSYIEQKLNIDLDCIIVTPENVNERVRMMLGSATLPDMMVNLKLTNADIIRYGVDGALFLPISDYINEELTPNLYKLLNENSDAAFTATAPDGKIYTIPTITNNDAASITTFISKKYLNAIGLEEAPDTLDGYLDMLRAFKALDPATMGVDEIWPMVTVRQLDGIFLQNAFGWAASNRKTTAVPLWDVETQSVVLPCMQEKYADYLEFMNTLYSEGLIHPDYFTMSQEAARALVAEGKAPVFSDWAPYMAIPVEEAEDYYMVTPLKSDWNKDGMVSGYTSCTDGLIFISADTEYPELCVRFLDYLYSEEGLVYENHGAPKGSEDTLGLIEGYEFIDGAASHGDAAIGFESDYHYEQSKIALFGMTFDNALLETATWKLAGITEKPEKVLTENQQHDLAVTEGRRAATMPNVFMSVEDVERFSDLQTVIMNYVNVETSKFVVGQKSLDEVDEFFDELNKLGADEYLEIYLNCIGDYKGPQLY